MASKETLDAMGESNEEPLLSVRNLKTYYPVTGGLLNRKQDDVKAVDGVSFDINRGETVGLAGESGCGKTTVAKTILGLVEETAGEVVYDGQDLTELNDGELREVREDIGVVFQDPFSSLNPRMTVRKLVAEPLVTHRDMTDRERNERVAHLLERVGLSEEHMRRYPHEFSGGQRQRIAIARALALEPSFVILDEPTSALDVSVQARTLKLLDELQEELDLTYLLITHDLNVMRRIADRLLVMYLGRVMEHGPANTLFEAPHHPYTEALLSAVPRVGIESDPILLEGDVPSPRNPPTGCRFHTRCPYATEDCEGEEPALNAVREAGRAAAGLGEQGWNSDVVDAVQESRCRYRDPRSDPPEDFDQ
ncbi:ABC transporter ATP-binding protein [Halobacterium wangiae]|uniref:ABC transporter ATP-binding protein n=1 Tax=Halobacterium wangiae TaxID=2902623 RepID=UPI001E408652|nr:ABC transporter ATP-binding protein [Halobacterium wangiae]